MNAPQLTAQAVHCRACETTLIPDQAYGCERCGAPPEQLDHVELPAQGRLKSFATVHVGAGAPFLAVEVVLDSGQMIRALGAANLSDPVRGVRVAATTRADNGRLVFEEANR